MSLLGPDIIKSNCKKKVKDINNRKKASGCFYGILQHICSFGSTCLSICVMICCNENDRTCRLCAFVGIGLFLLKVFVSSNTRNVKLIECMIIPECVGQIRQVYIFQKRVQNTSFPRKETLFIYLEDGHDVDYSVRDYVIKNRCIFVVQRSWV